MDYRVPMKQMAVQVALASGTSAEYAIFLAPYSDRREGPETIEDYLNGVREFLPMMHDGAPKIINRDQVLWVLLNEGVLPPPAEEGDSPAVQREVSLELTDGSRLDGYIEITRPEDSSRISDVLNDSHATFIRLSADRAMYFVNKHYIRVALPR